VVWTLAFAPFIGYALELWTAGLNGMSFDEAYEAVSGGSTGLSRCCSISLGYLDERRRVRPEADTPRSANWPAGTVLSVARAKHRSETYFSSGWHDVLTAMADHHLLPILHEGQRNENTD
jgi:hypothetical protein